MNNWKCLQSTFTGSKSLVHLIAIAAGIVLCFTTKSAAQELLQNGDFESPSLSLSAWIIQLGNGSSATLVATNSPFDDAYAGGQQALLVHDDPFGNYWPVVQESFTPQTQLFFAFDFKMTGTNGGWYVAIEGDDGPTSLLFEIGTKTGFSLLTGTGVFLISGIGGTQLTTLDTNSWYHVQLWTEVANRTIEGFILSQSGVRVDFVSSMPYQRQELTGISISDDSTTTQNSDILFDNIAVRPMTLDIRRLDDFSCRVSWLGSTNFILQSCTNLSFGNQWTNISSNVTSVTNFFSDPSRFYRLVR